jgi:SAM-dependent methyltransferase
MQVKIYQRQWKVNESHWWFKSRREIFYSLLKKYSFLNTKRNFNILDYGCGAGSNIPVLLKLSNNIYVYDVNYKIQLKVEKKFKLQKFRRNTKYNIILLTDVLEHTNKPNIIIKEINLKLKKNGYLLVTVPALNFLFSSKDKALKHYKRYNKKELIDLIPKNYKIIKFSYYNFFLSVPIIIIIIYYKLFKIKFIKKVESVPLKPLNYLMSKIFSLEKFFLKFINFPIGISLILILKKN